MKDTIIQKNSAEFAVERLSLRCSRQTGGIELDCRDEGVGLGVEKIKSMSQSPRWRRDWNWEMIAGSKLTKFFRSIRTSGAEHTDVWRIDFKFRPKLFDQSNVSVGLIARDLSALRNVKIRKSCSSLVFRDALCECGGWLHRGMYRVKCLMYKPRCGDFSKWRARYAILLLARSDVSYQISILANKSSWLETEKPRQTCEHKLIVSWSE
jgi:hypothetical protein